LCIIGVWNTCVLGYKGNVVSGNIVKDEGYFKFLEENRNYQLRLNINLVVENVKVCIPKDPVNIETICTIQCDGSDRYEYVGYHSNISRSCDGYYRYHYKGNGITDACILFSLVYSGKHCGVNNICDKVFVDSSRKGTWRCANIERRREDGNYDVCYENGVREEDINSDYVMFVDSCKRREKGEDLKNDFNKKIANNLAEKIMVYSYIRQCWYRGVIIRTDDGKFRISYDMEGKKFRFQFYIVKNVNKGSYISKEVHSKNDELFYENSDGSQWNKGVIKRIRKHRIHCMDNSEGKVICTKSNIVYDVVNDKGKVIIKDVEKGKIRLVDVYNIDSSDNDEETCSTRSSSVRSSSPLTLLTPLSCEPALTSSPGSSYCLIIFCCT